MSEENKEKGEGKEDPGKGLTEEQKLEIKKKKQAEEEEDDDAIELNPINAKLKKSRIVTFYDPPGPLLSDKVTEKENAENNLVRRWRVEIYNAEVQNLSGDTINPFILLFIDGDYRIKFKKTTSGGSAKEEKGEIGKVFKSNIIK